jgi:hypothetical protein
MEDLESRGAKVFYFHALQFSVGNKGKNTITEAGTKAAVTKASWSKIQLRKIALMIDYIRFELLLGKLGSDDYTHLVSDRYFYDSAINILYLSTEKSYRNFGTILLAKLARVPQSAFYLDVGLKDIQERERDIEQGETYVSDKIDLYRKYAKKFSLQKIDGRPKQDVIASEIASEIHTDITVKHLDPKNKSFASKENA